MVKHMLSNFSFHRTKTQLTNPRRLSSVRWAFAAIAGLIVTLTYAAHFVPGQGLAPMERLFILVYLLALFVLLAYWLMFRVTARLLGRFPRRARLVWALVAWILGVLLVFLLPITPPPPALTHRLEIVATGQKQAVAKRSEVWLTGLYRADGSQVPIAEFSREGTWELFDNVAASRQNQPAVLRWEGVLQGDARLQFASNRWTGFAQILWDGQDQTIDLYADVESSVQKSLTLSTATQNAKDMRALLYQGIVRGADTVSLGMALFFAAPWVTLWVARVMRVRRLFAG